MHQHEKLNYVEFGTRDINATKQFFEQTFGWSFVDYGPEYSAFSGQGLDGGFYVAEQVSQTTNGAALCAFPGKIRIHKNSINHTGFGVDLTAANHSTINRSEEHTSELQSR